MHDNQPDIHSFPSLTFARPARAFLFPLLRHALSPCPLADLCDERPVFGCNSNNPTRYYLRAPSAMLQRAPCDAGCSVKRGVYQTALWCRHAECIKAALLMGRIDIRAVYRTWGCAVVPGVGARIRVSVYPYAYVIPFSLLYCGAVWRPHYPMPTEGR